MKSTRAYTIAACLFLFSVTLSALGYFGLQLFVTHPLFDVFPHFISGLSFGLGAVEFLVQRNGGVYTQKQGRAAVLFTFLVAGVAWEIYEIFTNQAGYVLWTLAYYVDTLKDIVMGVGGAIVAVLIYERSVK